MATIDAWHTQYIFNTASLKGVADCIPYTVYYTVSDVPEKKSRGALVCVQYTVYDDDSMGNGVSQFHCIRNYNQWGIFFKIKYTFI